ncbi:hypothetical protein ONZ45_g9926 [Pleurotus djamor]|nr:hypothetical protein ONZ45_g9926 [Pleurotus djamor]
MSSATTSLSFVHSPSQLGDHVSPIRSDLSIAFVPRILSAELDLFLAFSWRDWSATLIPGLIVALGATKHASLPPLHAVAFIPWVTAFIYFFNLSNQVTGLEEDRINKPDRPLVTGKVSIEGAKRRWVTCVACFLGIAAKNGRQVPETLMWIAITGVLCLIPAGGHWFVKNTVGMMLGAWAFIGGTYKAVAVPTAEIQRFMLVVGLWVGVMAQAQDLRDIEGDRAIGRKTLPVAIGEARSRFVITLLMIPLGYGILWAGGVAAEAPILLLAAHAVLGYRITSGKGAQYDHKTYMLFTYLFCAVLAVPIWSDLHNVGKTSISYAASEFTGRRLWTFEFH